MSHYHYNIQRNSNEKFLKIIDTFKRPRNVVDQSNIDSLEYQKKRMRNNIIALKGKSSPRHSTTHNVKLQGSNKKHASTKPSRKFNLKIQENTHPTQMFCFDSNSSALMYQGGNENTLHFKKARTRLAGHSNVMSKRNKSRDEN